MNKSEIKEKVGKLARKNFKEEHNCAESVAKAILQSGLVNFPIQTTAAATGFGGGLGSSGNNCGALTGAVLATGLKLGRISPNKNIDENNKADLRGRPGIYRAFNQIPYMFEKEFGSTVCRELIKDYDISSIERKKMCAGLVEGAAKIAAEIIMNPEEYMDKDFHNSITGKK